MQKSLKSPSLHFSIEPSLRVQAGRDAERRAEKIFVSHHPGACLLSRNLQRRGFELDLVFYAPPGELVFLEVKMRSSRNSFHRGVGEESVGAAKRRRIEKGALWFMASSEGRSAMSGRRLDAIRFSVIVLGPGEYRYWPRAWG